MEVLSRARRPSGRGPRAAAHRRAADGRPRDRAAADHGPARAHQRDRAQRGPRPVEPARLGVRPARAGATPSTTCRSSTSAAPSGSRRTSRCSAPRWRRGRGPGRTSRAGSSPTRRWLHDNEGCRQDILELLRSDGPLTARELPDTCVRPWRSSGWNNNRNVVMMLEVMVHNGDVAVAGRRGRDRLWDLAERIYPRRSRSPGRGGAAASATSDACARSASRGPPAPSSRSSPWPWARPASRRSSRGSAASGGSTRSCSTARSRAARRCCRRSTGCSATASGWPRSSSSSTRSRCSSRSPQRRWGYYALPILVGDRLVGKLDAAADVRAGVLRVHAVHRDGPWSAADAAAVDARDRGPRRAGSSWTSCGPD